MDTPPSKKQRSHIDMSHLSDADQQAFERVASLLNKPLSELYEGTPRNTRLQAGDVTHGDLHSWAVPTTQWEGTNNWQRGIGNGDIEDFVSFDPSDPWAQPPEPTFGKQSPMVHNHFRSQWTETTSRTPAMRVESRGRTENSGTLDEMWPRRSPSWSHEATAEEPWVSVPSDFLSQTCPQDEAVDDISITTLPRNSEAEGRLQNPAQGDRSIIDHRYSKQGEDPVERPASCVSSSTSGDFLDSDANGPSLETEWEDQEISQISVRKSQLGSSPQSSRSGWSWIELPKVQVGTSKTPTLGSSNSNVGWVLADSSSKETSLQRPQRRGPFQDQQLREETSSTRKLKACVRCRMQKIRCQIDSNDPNGVCRTCQTVSKQKVHTLPCVRYKLTECTLYRIGKAPGLEFTFRWPVMKLRDISEWSDTNIRTIKITSDVRPIPLELSVRKFVPIPEDSLHKSWMDGKVKKSKETTPFAIVNMSNAVKDIRDYINTHVFECMECWLEEKDAWVQETYKFARKYMTVAPEEEASLLSNFFRLWFAIRRTATTEFIVGDDTLDMAPETTDRSFPLFGKVPLPPVMIQQLDMIVTLGLLQPLRKKVLEDFQKIVLMNKPKSWMTVYLVTFMSLHSCATLSGENYQNARKHGLKRKYAMPNFIYELHHGANVFLSHYHYCTKPCNPFTIDWRSRQTTPFAEMTTDEIQFLIKSSEMVNERKDKIRIAHQIGLYEDDIYFVSQMFEDDWIPRDTVIDYGDDTISDVSLKRFYNTKK